MQDMVNMRKDFVEYVKNQNTKVAQKVWNWLDHDNLSGIMADTKSKVYFIELTTSMATCPNYAIDYIHKFMKQQGYNHLV